jgi:hypothetical protein
MIKTIVKCHRPSILVITPLLTGSKVSKDTKKTLKRCKVPFEWVSYMGPGNPCDNAQKGFLEYKKKGKTIPPYIIKIDNDLIVSRGMLDVMYNTLKGSPNNISYCYCGFSFKGHINLTIPAKPFNSIDLMKENYISSCSLMKIDHFIEVGGWVTDDRGFRLLDWALWLKLLKKGYIGISTNKTSFVAMSGPNSVSSRSVDDYNKKKKWVMEEFG